MKTVHNKTFFTTTSFLKGDSTDNAIPDNKPELILKHFKVNLTIVNI